ncbi:MAG: Uma2 family endonuclease [Acidobacteriota bacterium]
MRTQIEPLLTIDDLDAMPEDGNRYELIEGEILMSRAPGITHQQVLTNLMESFLLYLAQNRIGRILPGPGLIFDKYNAVIPDLIFVSNERRDQIISGERLIAAPELVVEILSPGTENERRDRNIKRRLYARFGVEEYWLIDPENQQAEIYRLQQGNLRLRETLTDDDEITSPLLPGYACKANQIFEF